MLCSAFIKFVAAMDDSAIVTFMVSFSASRLKGRDFFLLFFLSLDEPKNEPDRDDDLV
jgi:hypothetical protein